MQLIENFDVLKHSNDVLPFFYSEKEPYEFVPDFEETLKKVCENIIADYYLNALSDEIIYKIGFRITEYLNQCPEVKDNQITKSDLKITIFYNLHNNPQIMNKIIIDFRIFI